jgi:hypothetical protein
MPAAPNGPKPNAAGCAKRKPFRTADFFSGLLAVEVASEMAPKSVQPSALGSSADRGDRIEITLGNGRKLAVGVTIDPMALARLVQVLDRA